MRLIIESPQGNQRMRAPWQGGREKGNPEKNMDEATFNTGTAISNPIEGEMDGI